MTASKFGNNSSANHACLNYRGVAWIVEGCLAESPAEEAGILPGDRILEIGVSSPATPDRCLVHLADDH